MSVSVLQDIVTQAGMQTDRHTNKQTGRQADMTAGRLADKRKGRRQAGKQTDWLTDKQAGRQTGGKSGSQIPHTAASASPTIPIKSSLPRDTVPSYEWVFMCLSDWITSQMWAPHQEPCLSMAQI